METFTSYFFSADIRIRAAVILALLIVVFWWMLGKIIIKIASFLPYFLRVVFERVYLLIEVPICWFHEKAGSFFYSMDNSMASGGEKIDAFLRRWYMCWRKPKSKHIFLSIAMYGILLIWICIPYNEDEENTFFFSGQSIYLQLETQFTHWLEIHNLYEKQIQEVENFDESNQVEEENIIESIVMEVITQQSPLSIRDIPSTENCKILESVEKGNKVLWKGDMAFGNGSNGGIEPWIKVETSSGTIGWARLIYLCPVNEKDHELKLLID